MDLKNISLDLKNINLESVKAKIKSIDKKILIKFGIGFLSVIVFLIIYYAVLSQIVEKKKAQLDNMQKKQAEITKMNQEIKAKLSVPKLSPGPPVTCEVLRYSILLLFSSNRIPL